MLFEATAHAEVTVDRTPAIVTRNTFDPAHPPSEMPPLSPGEAAVTQSRFDCDVETTYAVTSSREHDARCDASVRVKSIHLSLHLNVTIWLPQNAPAKLAAHEEGHRLIAEEIYLDAEKIARWIAAPTDGKTLAGVGDDCPAAEKAAVQSAIDSICQNYLDRTGKRTSAVGDIYDEMTAHGTRQDPGEQEAIREAFAKEQGTGVKKSAR